MAGGVLTTGLYYSDAEFEYAGAGLARTKITDWSYYGKETVAELYSGLVHTF